MEFSIVKEEFYKKNILICLKGLILFIVLLVNKYVYEFRIDQEMILKLFIIIISTLLIIKFLVVKKISWFRNELNLPIFLPSAIIPIQMRVTVVIRIY